MELLQFKKQVEQAMNRKELLATRLSAERLRELEQLEEEIWSEPRSYSMELLYVFMPFSMQYETRYHEKERYHAIQEVFGQAGMRARELMQDVTVHQQELGWYMMALVDCCEVISKEQFDHYKNLEMAFKQVLHAIRNQMPQLDADTRMMMSYAVLKACRLRMILAEKYLPLGMTLYKKAQEDGATGHFAELAREEYDSAKRED